MEQRVVKLTIASNLQKYGPRPENGDCMLQRITIREDGRVWYTTRVWNDERMFDYAPGERRQFRIDEKDARSILRSAQKIIDGTLDVHCFATDVGSWEAWFTLSDGTVVQDRASLAGGKVLDTVSRKIRKCVPVEGLAVFGD